MSIDDGQVRSRVPAFDKLYGISELKNTSDRLSGNKTKVLVALGGYPEDSSQFSRLGRDPVAIDTPVVDIVTMMVDLRLDGIAIHWVVPTGACQPSDVHNTLSALFANIYKPGCSKSYAALTRLHQELRRGAVRVALLQSRRDLPRRRRTSHSLGS
ncbi:hypothetical protein HPB47_017105 [Ixodes persulcatus]|uniref:Uncharacterized protein n=1 Tax=Ixodes persulcatus TaxID=34615 RepID=A0AC60QP62_IXOPE|nr:hypothetical protein HPB47_017105 [Ixodes persulcatus]